MDNTRVKAVIIAVVVVAVAIIGFMRQQPSSSTTTPKSETTTQQTAAQNAAAYDATVNAEVSSAQQKAAAGDLVTTASNENDSAFDYVAGTGESYSALARAAIAKTDNTLTHAERVAAETKMTQDAGVPYLEIAERITINKSVVNEAIAWAKSLTPDQQAAWQPYADMIAW